MKKISYKMQVSSGNLLGGPKSRNQGLSFGERISDSSNNTVLESRRDLSMIMSDGISGNSLAPEEHEKGFIIHPSTYVQDGRLCHTGLNGIYLSFSKVDYTGDPDADSILGYDKLAIKVPSYLGGQSDVLAAVFRREGGQISIDHISEVLSPGDAQSDAHDIYKTEFDGTITYTLAGAPQCISDRLGVSGIFQSDKLSYTLQELDERQREIGLFGEDLSRGAEYFDVRAQGLQPYMYESMKRQGIAVPLNYFPTMPEQTLIVVTGHGLKAVTDYDLDYKQGVITLNQAQVEAIESIDAFYPSNVSGGKNDHIYGFYILYATVPGVYHGVEASVLHKSDIIQDRDNIALFDIQREDSSHLNNRFSKQYTETNTGLWDSTQGVLDIPQASLQLFSPSLNSRVFIEPDSPIEINGNRCDKGRPYVMKNSVKNYVQLRPTMDILDMLTDIPAGAVVQVDNGDGTVSDTYTIPGDQSVDEMIQLVGIFKYGSRLRVQSASSTINQAQSARFIVDGFGDVDNVVQNNFNVLRNEFDMPLEYMENLSQTPPNGRGEINAGQYRTDWQPTELTFTQTQAEIDNSTVSIIAKMINPLNAQVVNVDTDNQIGFKVASYGCEIGDVEIRHYAGGFKSIAPDSIAGQTTQRTYTASFRASVLGENQITVLVYDKNDQVMYEDTVTFEVQ